MRKGAHDAGVECFCKLPDGQEWGWQAKYFTSSLKSPQWRQIDESVKDALNKHPELVRYFVCLPLDLPDARRTGQQSALQRWDKNIEKWNCWAHERQMSVEFILWGSFELTDRLIEARHRGRVYYWFDNLFFDEEWFRRNSRQATRAAGPRFTPELHVDLPIAGDIELFGRTDSALNQFKVRAKDIRQALSYVRHASTSDDGSSQEVDLAEVSHSVKIEELQETGQAVLNALSFLDFSPN